MKLKLKAALYTLLLLAAIATFVILVFNYTVIFAKFLIGFTIGVMVAVAYMTIYDYLMDNQV